MKYATSCSCETLAASLPKTVTNTTKFKKMKKIFTLLTLTTLLFSCNSNPEKEKVTNLLKEKIGNQLPFKDVKIASIENGTAVIVDGSWCYWIDANDKIFCVNGTSKSMYNVNNPKCEDAPIKAMFSDIEKIAQ